MSEQCGEPAGSFIAGYSWFTCVLPKGHKGEHERGGTCFKHGEYVGDKCPKWPDCIPSAAPPAPSEQQDRLEEIRKRHTDRYINSSCTVKGVRYDELGEDIDWLLSRLDAVRALAEKWRAAADRWESDDSLRDRYERLTEVACANARQCADELLTALGGKE